MKDMISKIWKDPVGSTLISVGILGVLGYLGNFLSDGWVLSALWTIWDWIVICLFFRIAVIWILCGLSVIVAGLYVYIRLRLKFEESNIMPFLSYTEDVFDGYKFRWEYRKGYFGKYEISNLTLLCPKCETPMHSNYNGHDCPRCNHQVYTSALKTWEKIEAIIVDNVKRDMYKKS